MLLAMNGGRQGQASIAPGRAELNHPGYTGIRTTLS